MQEKIEKLETRVSELTYEIRSLVATQKDIAETLREFKDINTKIALMGKDTGNNKRNIDRLFITTRELESKVAAIEKSDSIQGIKLGGAERGLWILITGAVAVAVGYFRGGA